MQSVPRFAALAALFLGAVGSASAFDATRVTLRVTNLTHGNHLTPLFVTAHTRFQQVFRVGDAASASVRAMAEGGDISGLLTDFGGADSDTLDGRSDGLLPPGGERTAVLTSASAANTHLSIVSMLLPTNDAFAGLDAVEIPSTPGRYVYYLDGYDAGTEANDERLTGGGAPGAPGIPGAPGGDAGSGGTGAAGPDTNARVHVHRGVLGDVDPSGGVSDLDSRIHRWQNPVVRVELIVE